ncbi:DUF3558 family protein [Amycolatopsis cihanbeyliensis]|uniref:Uncharacterized protein DUF3558 n=1 Tax=Amycolatopsis cihanbeyliensis TaxID=1128664 RepID=A0A542DLB3_AMYCI|nr:DUF3558 family protein [Amycolatopsis cihanbeyliensis]TQJ03891.1 uncharacterized protein DUF3558 [Amycolatopsis cihanbeyliensis]
MALLTPSCAAGDTDGEARPAESSQQEGSGAQDCTELVRAEEIIAAVGKQVRPDDFTNEPPNRCGYEISGGGLVSVGFLPGLPAGQGSETTFEGHDALLNDSSAETPANCALFIRLGEGERALSVNVRQPGRSDLCGVTRELASTAVARS